MLEKYADEFRSLSFEDLHQVQKILAQTIKDKRSHEIESIRSEVNAKARMLGIDVAEIMGNKKTATRKSVPAKYRIVEPDGTVHEWSGRGIRPKVFSHYSKEELDSRFRI